MFDLCFPGTFPEILRPVGDSRHQTGRAFTMRETVPVTTFYTLRQNTSALHPAPAGQTICPRTRREIQNR